MLNVTAVGNLASDPVQKETAKGTKVTSFTLLTNDQDTMTQFDCAVWGNRGDVIANYVKKGNQITVVGRGKLKTFERRDGSTGASIEINVDNFTLPVRSRDFEAIPA